MCHLEPLILNVEGGEIFVHGEEIFVHSLWVGSVHADKQKLHFGHVLP